MQLQSEVGEMELMGITVESDTTWMKFADMMVETGVISDCIENSNFHRNNQEDR